MPSSRMYSMNSGGSLIMRERMHDVRYLTYALAVIMSAEASEPSQMHSLGEPVVVRAVQDMVPCDRRKVNV